MSIHFNILILVTVAISIEVHTLQNKNILLAHFEHLKNETSMKISGNLFIDEEILI